MRLYVYKKVKDGSDHYNLIMVRKYYLNYILRFNWRKFGVNVKLSTGKKYL